MQSQTLPLLFCALLAVPGAAAAQTAAPSKAADPAVESALVDTTAPRPMVALLDMPDGAKAREYQVDDMSISVSRTMDGRGDSRGDVTVSFGAVRPLDAAMLQWARQGEVAPDASRRLVITIPAMPASVNNTNASAEARYELEGARVVGFSASYSSSGTMGQVMLQVSARRATLNGVQIN